MKDSVSENSHPARPPIAILGVPIDNVTTHEAVEFVKAMLASGKPHYFVTPNVDFLVQARKDVELRRILFEAHLVLCDGMPLVWASRLLGNPLPERVAGADLVPLLLRLAAEKNHRVFFLGGTPASIAGAVARVKAEYPQLATAGYSPPFHKLLEMDHDDIKRRIQEFKPHLLFVSFGCPKQEKWLAMHYQSLGVPVCAGVGGTIDFLAGQLKRAPVWMQRTGLEWIFRLLQEPRRLFRRYVEDLTVFGWAILQQWWQLQFHLSQEPDTSPRTANAASSVGPREPRPEPTRYGADSVLAAESWQRITLPGCFDLAASRDVAFLPERFLADARHCLVEAGRLNFIDSAGVAWLINLHKSIHAAGRCLILLAPSPALTRALAFLRLQDFFDIASDPISAQWLVAARLRERAAAVRTGNNSAASLLWQGEITAANVHDVWRHTAAQINCRMNSGPLIIDLSRVRFIDSAGLGLMDRARKLAQGRGLKLDFSGAQPAVCNVMRFARRNGLPWAGT